MSLSLSVSLCCRKVDPFQGPKLGSCLTLGNELSKETHVLTKQEILLGKGAWAENSRVRECCYGDGISFRVVFGQSFKFSLSWWHMHRSAKMDASKRDSGKWTDTRCLLLTFPELFRLVVAY